MITRIVKLSIDPKHKKKFTALFLVNRNKITAFNACYSVELLADMNDESIFSTYSKWESTTAIEAYRNSTTFREIWDNVKPLFNDKALAWSTQAIH